MAADSPKPCAEPDNPRSRCQLASCTCAAGRPRRSAELSITSSCRSAKACSNSKLAAADRAAGLGAAPHNQPKYMKVDRRHLPPETNFTKMSPAASKPAPSSSLVRRAATKSSTMASTASRTLDRQASYPKVPAQEPAVIACESAAGTVANTRVSHNDGTSAGLVSRWLKRLTLTRSYPSGRFGLGRHGRRGTGGLGRARRQAYRRDHGKARHHHRAVLKVPHVYHSICSRTAGSRRRFSVRTVIRSGPGYRWVDRKKHFAARLRLRRTAPRGPTAQAY